MTGAGGDFQIFGLAEGQYMPNVQKPGFTRPREDFQRAVIQLTSSSASVQLKLAPLGVIEGTLLDQYSEPVSGVRMLAIQVRIQDGYRSLTNARSALTDDRGRYRLAELMPGKYYIKAAGRSSGTSKYTGEGTAKLRLLGQLLTGLFERRSRHPFRDAADDRGWDTRHQRFQSDPGARFKIRGTLSNFPANDTVTFELVRGDDDAHPAASH